VTVLVCMRQVECGGVCWKWWKVINIWCNFIHPALTFLTVLCEMDECYKHLLWTWLQGCCRKSAIAPPPSCYKFLRVGHQHLDRWIKVEIMIELLGASSHHLKHEFLTEIGVLFSCDRQYTWIAHRMAWIISDMFFPTPRSVHCFMTNNNDGLNLVFCCTLCNCEQK